LLNIPVLDVMFLVEDEGLNSDLCVPGRSLSLFPQEDQLFYDCTAQFLSEPLVVYKGFYIPPFLEFYDLWSSYLFLFT